MKQKMKKGLALILAGVCLSLSGCSMFPKEEDVLAPPLVKPKNIVYETITPERGDIEKTVKVTGSFISVMQYDLAFKERSGSLAVRNVANGYTVKKGDLLARLDTDDLEYQIKQQELRVYRAQLVYNSATGTNEKEMARIDLQMAQLQLDSYKKELNKCSLYSPCDGKVVYIRTENIGDYVSAGSTFVRIADPDNMQISYKGDKSTSFPLGSKVTVTYKKQQYEGEVVMNAENAPDEAKEDMKKAIRVALDAMPEEAKMGDSADIEILLEKSENALLIPVSAITPEGGNNYVRVLEDGVRVEKAVELGIQTSTKAEVISGLDEDDQIIVK